MVEASQRPVHFVMYRGSDMLNSPYFRSFKTLRPFYLTCEYIPLALPLEYSSRYLTESIVVYNFHTIR